MFEELGKSLDNLFRSISKNMSVTRIEPRTDPISIDYPAAEPVKLRLEMAVGTLKLTPGGEKLVEGGITYNVQEWAPQTLESGGQVTLKQEHGWPFPPMWDHVQNDWVLSLGTVRPYELRILKGVVQGNLSLDGLPLTSVAVDIGAGDTTVEFRKPNPQVAERASFRTGTGSVDIAGLLNLNAKYISIDSGTGKLYLDFTGESLRQDLVVNVNVGTGEVILSVQRGVPARVTVTHGLGQVLPRGDFKAVHSDRYEAGNYSAASGPKITFNIQSGVGNVTLTTLTSSDSTRTLG